MAHWTPSSPTGVQLIVHGPGSQLGVQVLPSGRLQLRLHPASPPHWVTQLLRPLQPMRQI